MVIELVNTLDKIKILNMKKILIVLAFFTGIVTSVHSQNKNNSLDPNSSLSIHEVNKANGTAQPVMKDGKTYLQWVSEQKAKQLSAVNTDRKIAISVPVQNRIAGDKSVADAKKKTSIEKGGLTGNVLNTEAQDPSAKQSTANNTPAKPEEAAKTVSESSRNAEAARKD